MIIETAFWLFFGLAFYVYAGYPTLVGMLSLLLRPRFVRQGGEPSVSIVITAYNEEKTIEKKLENTVALDYPRDKLEIVVGSDGSTDRTNDIVAAWASKGVRLLAFPKNRGKTPTQYDSVQSTRNEIVVFMDAAPLCAPDVLRKLVRHFSDHRVGVVAGRMAYVSTQENTVTESQGMYWKYEMVLKRLEGRLGLLVGVDGPLYAMRRKYCLYMKPEIMEDFIAPLRARHLGAKVVLDYDAVTYEEMTTYQSDELRTRKRVILSGFSSLARHPELLDFIKHPLLAWQIISHKVLRWLVGLWYVGMVVTSAVASITIPFYRPIIGLLLLVIAVAAIGFAKSGIKAKAIVVPYYFALVNLAGLMAFWDFLRGRTVVSWQPVRN